MEYETLEMFSKRERRKSKCISGGTKVCKAKEVRKYFVNSKIKSFWHVCKLHYVQFGFQIYISSRLQMFFGSGALKNFAMFAVKYLCWSFFLIMLQAFMSAISLKRDSNIGVFLWNLRNLFYRTLQVAASGNILWTLSLPLCCIWKWWMVSLDVRFGSPALISFYCVCFVSFYFFLFSEFYYLLGYCSKFVNT